MCGKGKGGISTLGHHYNLTAKLISLWVRRWSMWMWLTYDSPAYPSQGEPRYTTPATSTCPWLTHGEISVAVNKKIVMVPIADTSLFLLWTFYDFPETPLQSGNHMWTHVFVLATCPLPPKHERESDAHRYSCWYAIFIPGYTLSRQLWGCTAHLCRASSGTDVHLICISYIL